MSVTRLESRPSIGGAVRAGLELLGPAWRRAWLSIVLSAAAMTAWFMTRPAPVSGAWLAATGLGLVVSSGALWRLQLGGSGMGPGGLQLGMVEVRLAAVAGLAVLFMLVLSSLAFIILLAFAYAAASAGHGFDPADVSTWARAVDSRGRALVTVVAGICLAALTWAALRISLAAAATTARGRIQVLASWPLTRGQVTRILLANLILAIGPGLFAGALVDVGVRYPALSLGARGLAAVAIVGVCLPLSTGLMSYFYTRLDAPGEDSLPR